MTDIDASATQCAEAAKNYCEATKALKAAETQLQNTPEPDAGDFLEKIAQANDWSRSPRPKPEKVVEDYARALNAREKAEDAHAKAEAAADKARLTFESKLDLLRQALG
jgi:hypothetical protein